MRPRFKTLLFYGAYLIAVVLLLEVVLQGYYWITAGQPLFSRVGRPMYRAEPLAGWGVKPDLRMSHKTSEFSTQVHTNSRGFRVSPRHEEYAYEKPADVYRVLLLGPSFAFGWGVNHEDTLAARLEGLLRAAGVPGYRDVEVINAGVPAIQPRSQLRWLKGEGVGYKPDLIVQLAYGSMAGDPNPDPGLIVDEEGNLVVRDATTFDRIRGQMKKSAIVFYGWLIAVRASAAFGDKGEEDTAIQGAGRVLHRHASFDPGDSALAGALEYYADLQKTADDVGARLMVVFFPLSYCVHEEDLARWRHLGVKDVAQQIAFDDAFCAYLRSLGRECLDLTQDLRAEAAKGKRLYYFVDIHWTVEGNRIVAEKVADQVSARR